MSKQQAAKAATTRPDPIMFAASGPELAAMAAAGDTGAQAELDRRNAKRVKANRAPLVDGKPVKAVKTPEQIARDEAYKAMSPEERKAWWAAKPKAAKKTAAPVLASSPAPKRASRSASQVRITRTASSKAAPKARQTARKAPQTAARA
jgi:hypothetical protein